MRCRYPSPDQCEEKGAKRAQPYNVVVLAGSGSRSQKQRLQMAARASSNHVLELRALSEPIHAHVISCIRCRPISLRPALSVPIEIPEVP